MATVGFKFYKNLVSIAKFSCSKIPIRDYVKPLIRSPIAVLTVDEAKDLSRNKNLKYIRPNINQRSSDVLLHNGKNYNYTFLDDGDENVGPYILKVKESGKKMLKNRKILLEGSRLIAEAIHANLDIKCIYFTKKELLESLPLTKLISSKAHLFKVRENHLSIWSETDKCSGLLAIACQPQCIVNPGSTVPVTAVFDGIKDEGQMGTLIRSAAAAGIKKIMIVPESADPWSPKALRAGMGSHFYIPLTVENWEATNAYVNSSTHLYVLWANNVKDTSPSNNHDSVSSMQSVSYDTITYKTNSMVIIGNEEPSDLVSKLLESRNDDASLLHVPTDGDLFTPVICGSTLLFEMKRQFEKLASQN